MLLAFRPCLFGLAPVISETADLLAMEAVTGRVPEVSCPLAVALCCMGGNKMTGSSQLWVTSGFPK